MTQPSTAQTLTAAEYLATVAEQSDLLARRLLATGGDRTGVLAQATAARTASTIAAGAGPDAALTYLAAAALEARADFRDPHAAAGVRAVSATRYTTFSRLHAELAHRYGTPTRATLLSDAPTSPALQLATDTAAHAAHRVQVAALLLPGELASAPAPSRPLLPFEPTVHVAVQQAPGFPTHVSVHFDRRDAVRALAARAREVLQARIDYVPLSLQGEPDLTSVVEALQGNGLSGDVQESTLQW